MLSMKKILAKLLAALQDSGWKSISVSTGGTIFYRKKHGVVYIDAYNITLTVSEVLTTIATLPEGYRPSGRHTAKTTYPTDLVAYMNFTTDGKIQVVRYQAQTVSDLYFSASFIAA